MPLNGKAFQAGRAANSRGKPWDEASENLLHTEGESQLHPLQWLPLNRGVCPCVCSNTGTRGHKEARAPMVTIHRGLNMLNKQHGFYTFMAWLLYSFGFICSRLKCCFRVKQNVQKSLPLLSLSDALWVAVSETIAYNGPTECISKDDA